MKTVTLALPKQLLSNYIDMFLKDDINFRTENYDTTVLRPCSTLTLPVPVMPSEVSVIKTVDFSPENYVHGGFTFVKQYERENKDKELEVTYRCQFARTKKISCPCRGKLNLATKVFQLSRTHNEHSHPLESLNTPNLYPSDELINSFIWSSITNYQSEYQFSWSKTNNSKQ